jgi:hypothetical protein
MSSAIYETVDIHPASVKSTSELPDDVGTVFVAVSPGYPFVAIGRRHPDTRELYVGSMAGRKDGVEPANVVHELVNDLAELTPEIVEGQEAEELLGRLLAEINPKRRLPTPQELETMLNTILSYTRGQFERDGHTFDAYSVKVQTDKGAPSI